MKIFSVGLVAFFLTSLGTTSLRGDTRTMANLPGLPIAGLRVILPQEAYQKLINEPIKAWIVVRGQIMGSKIGGARVIRSEARGVYDKVAVQMASEMELYTDMTNSRLPPSVLVHVLVYQLPKGEHAIALAQDDTLGSSNFLYSRSFMMRYLGLGNQKAPAARPKKQ